MIRIARIYDEPSADGSLRIFVDRLWARGVSRSGAKLDAWERSVAPTAELRKWFAHDPARFPEFRKKYFAELDKNPAALDLKKKYAGRDVTLLFAAKDRELNNAAVLKEWLER